MALSLELVNSNVVLVAKHFNASILSQLWLVDNGVVGREDFRPGAMYSDMVANIATKHFNLLVAPEQLQIAPTDANSSEATIAALTKIVSLLPHTPYTGIGLNFIWTLRSLEEGGAISRRLFFSQRSSLFQQFDVEDARFGAYLSRNALECRMKVDIKPVWIAHEEERFEALQYAFNFHRELGSNPTRVILELLANWDVAKQMTSDSMQLAVQDATP